jgi:preprotein translocase subunit SecG
METFVSCCNLAKYYTRLTCIASALTCSYARTCMLYKSGASSMAGCCDGSDTQDCGWVNSCIDYTRYASGGCGTNCQQNAYVMKCTNLAAPFCVKYTYPDAGVSDFYCDSTSAIGAFTIRQTATNYLGSTTSTSLPTVAAGALNDPTGSSGSSGGSGNSGNSNTTTYRRAKKLAVGAIVGIVIAVLAIFFFIAIGIVMCLKKKKKQKQIAANAQIVANVQANRPQSEFQPAPPPQQQQQMQMQPQMQQQGPMPTQSPQSTQNGYFSPPNQQDQKYNGHTSVQEYGTPVSTSSTPAPAYVQPYMAPNAPPMPQQHSGQYQAPANGAHEISSPVQQQHTGQYQTPMNGAHEVPSPIGVSQQHSQQETSTAQYFSRTPAGAHEVDAGSVPHAPGKTSGPVYEMGQGK